MSSYTMSGIPNGATAQGLMLASKKNILHNSDFRNPVNQRAASSYNGNAIYGLDRWIIDAGGGTYTVATRTFQAAANFGRLSQNIENAAAYSGKTVTFSIDIDTDVACTGVLTTNAGDALGVTIPAGTHGIVSESVTLGTITSLKASVAVNVSGNSAVINAVKLEIGSVSTLANDPPADFGEQKAICQRFYERITHNGSGLSLIGMAHSATSARFAVPFKASKRISPSLAYSTVASNNFAIFTSSNSFNVTGITMGSANADGAYLIITTSGLTAGESLALIINDTNGYLAFAADL